MHRDRRAEDLHLQDQPELPIHRLRSITILVLASLTAACSANPSDPSKATTNTPESVETITSDEIEGVFDVGGGRELYLRCSGTGSPTVVLEGGDEDDSSSYLFAEPSLAELTRTCVYDRANLGLSDPASGPRRLDDFVDDLDALLDAAGVLPPYVLVGTSGGGFIAAGYAEEHRRDIAGMVFIDTGQPLKNPPAEIVKFTAWDFAENIEQRDYLQIENAAWDGRKRIGDIPMTIVTVKYSKEEIVQSPFAVERAAMRHNVERQRGWLVLSPRAEQIVVHTSHAVEEDDPQLVINVIRDVVKAAR
jgi:pimeloyl-ACP methyl ester carboxylesterase